MTILTRINLKKEVSEKISGNDNSDEILQVSKIKSENDNSENGQYMKNTSENGTLQFLKDNYERGHGTNASKQN